MYYSPVIPHPDNKEKQTEKNKRNTDSDQNEGNENKIKKAGTNKGKSVRKGAQAGSSREVEAIVETGRKDLKWIINLEVGRDVV